MREILKQVIMQVLGNVVENFDSSEIEVDRWNGIFQKKNLQVKQSFLEQLGLRLGLPLELEKGVVSSFYMKVPWNKILTEGCQIIIKNIHILCRTPARVPSQFYVDKAKQQKLELIDRSDQISVTEIPQQMKEQKDQGYFKPLFQRIQDNIRILIENVHFRFEDQKIILENQKMAFGLVMKKLVVQPTNNKFEENKFVNQENDDHKYQLIQMNQIGIYFENNQNCQINSFYNNQEFMEWSENYLERVIQTNQFLLFPLDLKLHQKIEKNKEFVKNDIEYLVENVLLKIDRDGLNMVYGMLKYKEWCDFDQPHFKYRPDYRDRASKRKGNVKKWWKYMLNSVLDKVSQNRKAMMLENIVQKKALRNKYIQYLRLRTLYNAEQFDIETGVQKNKLIFEQSLFSVDSKVLRLDELDNYIRELEIENFSIDEISFYKQLVYDQMNNPNILVNIIKEQQQVNKQSKPQRLELSNFYKNVDFKINQQEELQLEEYLKGLKLQLLSKEKLKKKIKNHYSINQINIVLQSKKNLDFISLEIRQIEAESFKYQDIETTKMKVKKIIVEDLLAINQSYKFIVQQTQTDESAFLLDFKKQNNQNQQVIKLDVLLQPLKLTIHNEMITRLKYCVEFYDEFQNLNYFYTDYQQLHELQNYMQQKILNLFGHQLVLDIHIQLNQMDLTIPLNLYENDSELKFQFGSIVLKSSKNQSDDEDITNQIWEFDLITSQFQINYLLQDLKYNIIDPFDINMKFLRKFQQENNDIVSNLILDLNLNQIIFNIPINKNTQFYLMIESLLQIFSKLNRNRRKTQTIDRQQINNSSIKYSFAKLSRTKRTATRVHSSHFQTCFHSIYQSFSQQNTNNQFYDAVEELSEILNNSYIHDKYDNNNNNQIKESMHENSSQDILKGQLQYLKQKQNNQMKQVIITDFINFHFNLRVPKISIKFLEKQINHLYMGSSIYLDQLRLQTSVQGQQRQIKVGFELDNIQMHFLKFHKLYLFKCLIQEIQNKLPSKESADTLNHNQINFYQTDLLINIKNIEIIFFNYQKELKSILPLFKIRLLDNKVMTNQSIKQNQEIFYQEIEQTEKQNKLLIDLSMMTTLKMQTINQKLQEYEPFIEELKFQFNLIQNPHQIITRLKSKQEFLVNLSPNIVFSLLKFVQIVKQLVQNKPQIQQKVYRYLNQQNNDKKQKNKQFYQIINNTGIILKVQTSFTQTYQFLKNKQQIEIRMKNIDSLITSEIKQDNGFINIDSEWKQFQSYRKQISEQNVLNFEIMAEQKTFQFNFDFNQEKLCQISNDVHIISQTNRIDGLKQISLESNVYFYNNFIFDLVLIFNDDKITQDNQEIIINLKQYSQKMVPLSALQKKCIQIQIIENMDYKNSDYEYQIQQESIMQCDLKYMNYKLKYIEIVGKRQIEKNCYFQIWKYNHEEQSESLMNSDLQINKNKVYFMIDKPVRIVNSLPYNISLVLEQQKNRSSQPMGLKSHKSQINIASQVGKQQLLKNKTQIFRKQIIVDQLDDQESVSNDSVLQEMEIKSGSFYYLHQFDINKELFMSMVLKGFKKSSQICLNLGNFNQKEKKEVEDSSENERHEYWTESETQQVNNSQKEEKIFQLISQKKKQVNIVCQYYILDGVLEIKLLAEFWILNQIPYNLSLRIQEKQYFYQDIKIDDIRNQEIDFKDIDFNINDEQLLNQQFSRKRFASESLYDLNKNEDGKTYIQNQFYLKQNALSSQKEVQQMIENKQIYIFSGDFNNPDKKVQFQILKNELTTKYSYQYNLKMNSNENTNLIIYQPQNIVHINSVNNNVEYSFVYSLKNLTGIYSPTQLMLLSPRYIIANQSPYSLEIQVLQKNSQRKIMKIESYQFRSLIQNLEDKKNYVSLRIAKNDFIWSPVIPIDKDGSYSIRLKNITNTNNQIIQLNNVKYEQTNLVIFSYNENQAPFLIENQTKHFFKIHQKGSQETQEIIQSFKQLQYSWDDPFKNLQLIISRIDSSRRHKKLLELDFENTKQDKIELQLFDEQFKETILVDISQNNLQKIIKFSEKQNRILENSNIIQSLQRNEFTYEAEIEKIGISIINSEPQELGFISIQNINLKLILDDEQQNINMQIQKFQIDDQTDLKYNQTLLSQYSINDPFKKKHNLSFSQRTNKTYFLRFKMLNSCQPNEMITKILNVKIAPIFMVIDGQFLMDIYTMLNRSFLEYNKYYKDESSVYTNRQSPLKSETIIENLYISRLRFQIRFQKLRALEQPLFKGELPFFSRFVNGSISVQINKYKVKNSKIIYNILQLLLKNHYEYQLRSQMMTVLASADIFGNPRELFGNLFNGLIESLRVFGTNLHLQPNKMQLGLQKGQLVFLINFLQSFLHSFSLIISNSLFEIRRDCEDQQLIEPETFQKEFKLAQYYRSFVDKFFSLAFKQSRNEQVQKVTIKIENQPIRIPRFIDRNTQLIKEYNYDLALSQKVANQLGMFDKDDFYLFEVFKISKAILLIYVKYTLIIYDVPQKSVNQKIRSNEVDHIYYDKINNNLNLIVNFQQQQKQQNQQQIAKTEVKNVQIKFDGHFGQQKYIELIKLHQMRINDQKQQK